MALAHAILASLLDEPRTGYDLARLFGSDGYFWRATHQQIYRELARLEAEDAVVPVDPAPGTRDERRRGITPIGRKRLAVWGREPSDPATIKEDVLVKCLALEVVDADALAEQIGKRREQHRARLDLHLSTLATFFPNGAPSGGAPLGRFLAAQGGIAYERAWVEWADMAVNALCAARGS